MVTALQNVEPIPILDERNGASKQKQYKWDIVWINVIVLAVLHAGAIYGLFIRHQATTLTLAFGKTIGICASFGVTAGAHRLWSHKSYQANTIVQILLALMMTFTYQNSIYDWCRDHRLHHKHSETDADPHNAKRGFFFSHVGWLFIRKHPDVIKQGKHIDMSDLKNNPIVMFQHKYYHILVLVLAVVIPVAVPVYYFGETFKIAFAVVCIRFIISVNLTWCINSVAHLYGPKPYNKHIGPTDNLVMSSIALGEGFHNYHHTYPFDYKASEYGSDARNCTTALIDMFAKIGWVTNRRSAQEDIINTRIEKTGDGSNNNNKKKRTIYDQLKFIVINVLFYYIL